MNFSISKSMKDLVSVLSDLSTQRIGRKWFLKSALDSYSGEGSRFTGICLDGGPIPGCCPSTSGGMSFLTSFATFLSQVAEF